MDGIKLSNKTIKKGIQIKETDYADKTQVEEIAQDEIDSYINPVNEKTTYLNGLGKLIEDFDNTGDFTTTNCDVAADTTNFIFS